MYMKFAVSASSESSTSLGCLHNSLQLLSQKLVQTTFSQLTFTHLQIKTLKQFAVAVVSTNNSRQCDFIRKSEPNSHSAIQLEILHVRYPIFVALLSNQKSIEPINATTTYLLSLVAYLILIRIPHDYSVILREAYPRFFLGGKIVV